MKKISIGLIFIVILIHTISAQNNISNNILNQEAGISAINYINIEILDNGFATIEEEIIVNNTIASIFAPLQIDVLSISDSKNRLKYNLIQKDGRQLITFYLLSPMDKTVRIRYNTQHITSKNGSIWTLKFLASATPHHTIVNVKFPANSNIMSLKPDIPRYPANLSNPMWLYPQTNEFYFEMDYQTTQSVQGTQPSDMGILYIILTIILILFLILILLIKKKKSKKVVIEDKKIVEKEEDKTLSEEKKENLDVEVKNKRKIKDSIIKMLDENEKKILEMLESSEDEITQAYVYKTTNIPKATLSDIMQRLEKRNIIERRRDGRISWIKLKDWVFD